MSGNHKIQHDEIFKYVKKKYGVKEDYPFPNAPSIPVMRHTDGRKLFAIIMKVRRKTLGLDGTGWADIINVKLGDGDADEKLDLILLKYQEVYDVLIRATKESR